MSVPSATMHRTSPKPALPAAERMLPAAVLALCAMLVLWEIWLAPIRLGGSWLALKALPLGLALPGLLRRRLYTRQWLSLLLPLYAAEGIVRAWTEPGRIRVLAVAEIVLALVAFVAIIVAARASRHATAKVADCKTQPGTRLAFSRRHWQQSDRHEP